MESNERLGKTAEDDGMSGALVFNGVDARTGQFLPVPPTEREFAQRIRDDPLRLKPLRETRWWVNHHTIHDVDDSDAKDDKNRRPVHDVDPLRLDSAGWGVIFAPGISTKVKEALEPLLLRRKRQAGDYYKPYDVEPNPTKEGFLAGKAGIGPADPKNVPYYLLIVGSPAEISFRFQYNLDIQYAVGRIHFEDEDGYAAYAANVVAAEEAAEKATQAEPGTLPEKRIALFGVSQQGDTATERSAKELIKPLADNLAADRTTDLTGWTHKLFIGSQASKEQLGRLLGGDETPSILFTASHGLSFSYGDKLQRSKQGALLCQDWPGEAHPVLSEHYFSDTDLATKANLRGLIAFHFGCYSGGTPEESNFMDSPLSRPQPLAPAPFISSLAQGLLGHSRGALAVIGHIDRAWTTSFSWSSQGQIQLYENTLKCLLDGHPIGSAMEYFNQRYAELAVEYADLYKDRDELKHVDETHFARVHRANNDARNFIVLGDPAVRAVFAKSASGKQMSALPQLPRQ